MQNPSSYLMYVGISGLVNLLLIGVIVWLVYIQKVERKDLYNRIMARNLQEYHEAVSNSPKATFKPSNYLKRK